MLIIDAGASSRDQINSVISLRLIVHETDGGHAHENGKRKRMTSQRTERAQEEAWEEIARESTTRHAHTTAKLRQ